MYLVYTLTATPMGFPLPTPFYAKSSGILFPVGESDEFCGIL